MELYRPTSSCKLYLSSGELVGKRIGKALSGFTPTNQVLTTWRHGTPWREKGEICAWSSAR